MAKCAKCGKKDDTKNGKWFVHESCKDESSKRVFKKINGTEK